MVSTRIYTIDELMLREAPPDPPADIICKRPDSFVNTPSPGGRLSVLKKLYEERIN